MTASVVGEKLGGEEVGQKGKRTHGHGQQWGDCWGRGIWGLNTKKKKYKKKNPQGEKKVMNYIQNGLLSKRSINILVVCSMR